MRHKIYYHISIQMISFKFTVQVAISKGAATCFGCTLKQILGATRSRLQLLRKHTKAGCSCFGSTLKQVVAASEAP